MLRLPSDKKLDRFAPVLDTDYDARRRELERKRSWIRELRGKPRWTTKEEALQLDPPKLQPMPCLETDEPI